MRIVFFGTPELAVPSLAALADSHEVTGVVCQPDRPKGRSKKLVAPPVKQWAVDRGLPVHQPTKLNDGAFEAWLKEHRPGLCAIAAYGRILKEPILAVPTRGYLNVHPSLLPRHRGTSPIQTSILQGDEVTGVTIMRLDAGMDTGDILLQETMPIEPGDTTATLSEKLAGLGADLLAKGVALVESGSARFTPQDDAQATYTKRYEKATGRIRWSAPARDIHNLVRAAVPWPVAHCLFRGATVRIHKTAVVEHPGEDPAGTVVRVENDAVVVAAGEGALALRIIQVPGKRPMSMGDYLRGHVISVGEVFEEL